VVMEKELLSSSFLFSSSTRNSPVPVFISTSGHRYCEVAIMDIVSIPN